MQRYEDLIMKQLDGETPEEKYKYLLELIRKHDAMENFLDKSIEFIQEHWKKTF